MALVQECSTVDEDGVLKNADALLETEVLESEPAASVRMRGRLLLDARAPVGDAEARVARILDVADVAVRTEQSVFVLHNVVGAAVLVCEQQWTAANREVLKIRGFIQMMRCQHFDERPGTDWTGFFDARHWVSC